MRAWQTRAARALLVIWLPEGSPAAAFLLPLNYDSRRERESRPKQPQLELRAAAAAGFDVHGSLFALASLLSLAVVVHSDETKRKEGARSVSTTVPEFGWSLSCSLTVVRARVVLCVCVVSLPRRSCLAVAGKLVELPEVDRSETKQGYRCVRIRVELAGIVVWRAEEDRRPSIVHSGC